jgi:hypothetical protein
MTTVHHTLTVAADDPAYDISAGEWNAAHDGTNDHGHTATGDGGTLAQFQPIDSDLTAIAALSTTSYGRAFLALADAAAGRTALGLGTASTHATGDYDAAGAAAAAQAASQPLDSDLTSIAALATTTYGRSLLVLANQAALIAEALPAIDATGAATDITTRNVSTSAHGLTPKLPNDATKYLDGTGAYSVPAGGGGGITQAFAGYNTVGGSWETFTNKRQYCKQITLANACLVTSIDAYLRPSTDAIGALGAVVLTDVAGAPSVLIASAGQASLYLSNSGSMPGGARWVTTPIGAWLAAGTYWICIIANTNSFDVAYDGSGSDQYFTASINTLTGAYPSAWAITTGTLKYSIRANTIR